MENCFFRRLQQSWTGEVIFFRFNSRHFGELDRFHKAIDSSDTNFGIKLDNEALAYFMSAKALRGLGVYGNDIR